MVQKRKALGCSIGIFGTVGVMAIAFVFFSSFKPTEKSLSELPHISLADLAPGSFLYVPHPVQNASSTHGMNILLIRSREARLFAYYVPTFDGMTAVPIDHPWWSDLKCAKFQPNFETSVISCMDNPPLSQYAKPHRWSLEGKNISRTAADLVPVRGVEEHGYFVLYKPVSGRGDR